MNRLLKALETNFIGFYKAVLRFPLTVICLTCETILTCYIISLHNSPDLIIKKWVFVFMLGSFLGVAAQVACERFQRLNRMRLIVYGASILLIWGYYMIILPAPSIDYGVGARTTVAVFSMFCAYIWLPSFRKKYDFNSVALVHFKSAFTAVLYAGVLAGGLAAILRAIDVLLFKINSDYYGYMMAIVWIMFATIYYLSLIPNFNSEEDKERAEEKSRYPRLLEILVSYISIPLLASYTLVLIAYFIKIGITHKWPSGQLGPMILGYSAAGLLIYVLASRLENRFAMVYQRGFPKVLIPIVVMQLISVYIRLNAYGFTESRYYLALFGIFSIVIGIVLSFKPVEKNGIIALLAAGFALFSVIPPTDAFTISRFSQVNRLEKMLKEAKVLVDGSIKPIDNADMTLRLETTSILNYLERRNYLKSVAWIPADFKTDKDMQKTFGFEPAYKNMNEQNFFYAGLNMQKPLNIEGFDAFLQVGTYVRMDYNGDNTYDFQVRGKQYKLILKRISPQEVMVSVNNAQGQELVKTGLYDFANSMSGISNRPKEAMSAEEMTLNAAGNGCKLRIIFQNINVTYGNGGDSGANYDMFILISVPVK